jgi:glycosyltransferase involved in cell wall biosynthesis
VLPIALVGVAVARLRAVGKSKSAPDTNAGELSVRVCHIFPTVLSQHGPSNVLLALLGELRAKGISSTVVSLRRPPADRNARAHVEALDAHYLELNMGRSVLDLGVLRPLMRVIESERVQIVQCNQLRANVYGTLATIVSGFLPTICVAHNVEQYMTGFDAFSRAARVIEGWSARRATAYVAVSQAVAVAVCKNIGIKDKKIVVIPNGLDDQVSSLAKNEARRRLNLSERSFVVGSVGRLHPQKGYADLLVAAAKLSRHIPNLKVVIIGEGPEHEGLEALAKATALNGIVHFAGARSDVTEVMSAFDVFTMPSYYEGLPLALLEAMRCGIPSVVTRAGGMPEAVVDGETGFVTEPADPSALTDRIRRLAKDRRLRDNMGRAGRERFAAQFTSSVMAARYCDLYDAILKGHFGAC